MSRFRNSIKNFSCYVLFGCHETPTSTRTDCRNKFDLMSGKQTAYGGTFGILNATQVANTPFVSMGIVHTEETDFEVITKTNSSSYRKLVFSKDGERLVGAVFVGDIRNVGLYRSLIRDRYAITTLKQHLVSYSLNYGHFLK